MISSERCRATLRTASLGALLFSAAACSDTKEYIRPPIDRPSHTRSNADVRQRILLIGDAGEPRPDGEPVLLRLGLKAAALPGRTTIIFLGDNIYQRGMPLKMGPERAEAVGRLRAQLDVVKASRARAHFVAGNHDWKNKMAGLKAQETYINRYLGTSDGMLPRAGDPGPRKVDLPGVRLIALDTVKWIDRAKRHEERDLDAWSAQLQKLVKSADREVIVMAHHPLATNGNHGGFYDWRDHLFPQYHFHQLRYIKWMPLPVLGSLYPAYMKLKPPSEDLDSPAYASVVKKLTTALEPNPPLIFAAGHDHSLQVLKKHGDTGNDAAKYLLVSGLGSGSKKTSVTHKADTLFSHLHPGFMEVDFMKDRSVILRVIEPGRSDPVFTERLR